MAQGFPNGGKGWGAGANSGIRNFVGRDFLPGGENLRRSDFGDLNLFQS